MQTRACQLNAAILISEWRAGFKLFAGEDRHRMGTAVVAVYQVRGITQTGVPYRIRAEFTGDADHRGSTSDWAYFKRI